MFIFLHCSLYALYIVFNQIPANRHLVVILLKFLTLWRDLVCYFNNFFNLKKPQLLQKFGIFFYVREWSLIYIQKYFLVNYGYNQQFQHFSKICILTLKVLSASDVLHKIIHVCKKRKRTENNFYYLFTSLQRKVVWIVKVG